MKKSFNRKSLLLPLLLLATGSAWAGWEKVYITPQATVYVDRASIRKDGDQRRMWFMVNYKQRGKLGEMSRRIKSEYDCKGERTRVLALSLHPESMAGGKALLSVGENSEGWEEVPPRTPSEALLGIACAQ